MVSQEHGEKYIYSIWTVTFMSFQPAIPDNSDLDVFHIESSVEEINHWMLVNRLKLTKLNYLDLPQTSSRTTS